MPFDAANFRDDEYQSYAREWLAAASQQERRIATLSSRCRRRLSKRCPFEQLLRFWQHPVRAFFQQRLRVNFRSEESDIPDDEPFTLEGLSRYQLNQQLLNTLIEQQDASTMYRRFRAAGSCPLVLLASWPGRRSVRRCRTLRSGVIASRQPGQSMEIDLQCNGSQHYGVATAGTI
ncbi:Exodeoxyribonuclease V gamma chain [Raoultella ornithinolytica]|nr:Exodeoxyribonuclease V gamma chain [Raoultella ornithinolytica]